MTQRIDLTPERIEFTVKRGDDWRFTITPDPISAWDGATFEGHIRSAYGATKDEDITISQSSGVLSCSVTGADIATLTSGGTEGARMYVGEWDVQATLASGVVLTIAKGGLTVESDVTRPGVS